MFKNNKLITEAGKSKYLPNPIILFFLTILVLHFGDVFSNITNGFLDLNFIKNSVYFEDFSIFHSLFCFIIIAIAIFAWVKFVEKRNIRSIGLPKKGSLKEFSIGLLIGFVLFLIVIFLMYIFGFAKFNSKVNFDSIHIFILLFIGWIIQSSTEEILSRGWHLPIMSNKYNVKFGLIYSSMFFALLHIFNQGITFISVLDLIVFGILAGLYTLKRGNIWGACGIHAAWNCAQGSLFGLKVSGVDLSSSIFKVTTFGPDIFSGGQFGPEGSIFSTITLLVACFLIIKFMKEKNK